MPGNRRHIPPEHKELVITMAATLSVRSIAHATGISERTVRRILQTWRETGEVCQRPYVDGRPRLLSMFNFLVLESLISRTPDIYLAELRDALLNIRGIDVCEQTIANALLRRRYSRKKVRLSFS
ncbi:hypothetical protein BC835DRAFT_1278930 [Cytidiella melzeri]|nr:hypothetical protein BC835DRAFT_1278930 [Cytidiella melzeri]